MFQFFLAFISLIILFYEIILYKRWKNRLRNWKYSKPLLVSFMALIIFTQVPLWIYVLMGRQASRFVITDAIRPFYYVYLSFQYPMFFSFPFFVVGMLVTTFSGKIRRTFTSIFDKSRRLIAAGGKTNPKGAGKFALSRKQFLLSVPTLALDTMPFILSTGSLTAMAHGSQEFSVDKIEIKIPDLKRDLQGFTILQISDIHTGNLINQEYLSKPLDIIKNIRADMMVVTGDIIDNNNHFLPVAGRFFSTLEGHFPYGMYGILGNHDFIDNGNFIYKTLLKSPLHLLKNESVLIKRGNGRMNLTGLVFPDRFQSGRSEFVTKAFALASKKIDVEIPSVVLHHYPADFDTIASSSRADLVLAGHTHGGQIRMDNDPASTFIPETLIKYIAGFYKSGKSSLYVNRGLGHWYPLRINCPPEITLITLV